MLVRARNLITGDVVNTSTSATIRADTSDGADNKTLLLTGGGAVSSARGASLVLAGNENGDTGAARLQAGNVSGGNVQLQGTHSTATVDVFTGGNLRRWQFQADGVLAQDATNGSDLVFGVASGTIRTNTSDGADSKSVTVTGGGAAASARGAVIVAYGNEASGNNGTLQLDSGNVTSSVVFIRSIGSSGVINLTAGGTTNRVQVKSTGQVRFVPLTADPAGAEDGDVYYNSTTNKLRVRAAGIWVDLH